MSNASVRRTPALAAVLTAALLGAVTVAPASAAAHHHHGHAHGHSHEHGHGHEHGQHDWARFAYRSAAYGSRVTGGQLPAASGTTSYQAIACTNTAGLTKDNELATLTLPSLGQASGVATRTWTAASHGTVSSNSSHDIARLVLAQSQFGSLTIRGISALSVASHDHSGFHATSTTDVASITYAPAAGVAQQLAIPTPGHPVVIPGLLTIALGSSTRSVSATGAKASADGLDITLVPTDTRVRVAHTAASIALGVTHGLFHGQSDATSATGLQNNLKSGAQPLTLMPCQGTLGHVRGKAVARIDLGDNIIVNAAATRQMGVQTDRDAHGYEQAQIASVSLGGGQLVLNGIVGRANVVRSRGHLAADTRGTTVSSAVANGTTYGFPDLDGLTIPGLVRVETNVVTKLRTGIDVVAVRLTLLDGSGAVVDLGHARLSITKARR